ncbi:hypothetical protein ACQ4PT_013532 [Festuca glaucescens]
MDLERVDAMSVHDSNQSSVSTVVDWSSLVIEPENDGDDKGIPDEKPVDENAMFTLLGLKTEAKELEHDLGRHELFMKTHTRKSGDPLDKAIPKMNELAKAATNHPELLEKPIEKGDLFSHVFGHEPRGYVRGVGLGLTPASLGIEGHHTCASTRVQMAMRHSRKTDEQNTLLKDALQHVVDEVIELREIVKAGQGDNATDRVSTPTPECGSNHSLPMLGGVANEFSDHDFHEDMMNNPVVEVMMPIRGRALLQPTRIHEEGGKEVVLLSLERPRD